MKKIILLYLSLFWVLTISAQTENGKGLNFNDDAYERQPMKAALTRSLYGSSLPSSASLKKWAPTPKSQGQYGTCTAWSSGYCALTIVQSIKKSRTDKTEITENAYAPGFIYSQIRFPEDANCSMGAYIDEALGTLKTKGAPKLSDFTESCITNVPSEIFAKASASRIKDFAKIFGNENNAFKISATKKSLSENKPVVIGMKCPNSFSNAKGVWNPTENFNDNFGGHAMCVIGYDDNQYGGAFEIQNSWGTWWGNEGYIWIRYQDFANFTKYAYELIDDLNPDPGQDIQLAGKFKLQLNDGSAMAVKYNGSYYKVQKSYRSGTKFRIYISNNEPAYVYSFGSDMTEATYQLFPYKPNISPALTYKQNDVALPDEESYIEMDNTTGTDHLCVLYSKNPLNIDDIRNRVERETGSFYEKIQKVLGNLLMEQSEIQYTGNKMEFNAKSKSKSVALILAEIEHIK
jgi:hypothetical protein